MCLLLASPYALLLLLDLASIFSAAPLGETSSINTVETIVLLLNNVSAPMERSVSPQEGVTAQDRKLQSQTGVLPCIISSPLFPFPFKHVQPILTSDLLCRQERP